MKYKFIIFSILVITVVTANFLQDDSTKLEKVNEIKDLLNNYTRADLIFMALAGDDYMRSKLPSAILVLRGLREFVNSLNSEELIDIISKQLVDYEGWSFDLMLENSSVVKISEVKSLLASLEREQLETVAYTFEKYERNFKGIKKIFGGLVDYIWRIKEKSEIEQIVFNYIYKYPKLGTTEIVQLSLSTEFITLNDLNLGLKSIEKDDLAKFAIALEGYERSKQDILFDGGLHDYAFTLSRQELSEVIQKFLIRNPELSFKSKLNEFIAEIKSSVTTKFGGLDDYIRVFFTPELKKMALLLSTKLAEKKGLNGPGSTIASYLPLMSKEDLMNSILTNIKEFPEYKSPGKLEEVSEVALGGIYHYLVSINIDNLKEVCIKVQEYDSVISGTKLTKRYALETKKLNQVGLISLFENLSLSNPEICDVNKLKEITGINFE